MLSPKQNNRISSLQASDLEDEMPSLPQAFVDKFPELEEFNRQWLEKWSSVKASWVKKEERITSLENRVTELEKQHP